MVKELLLVTAALPVGSCTRTVNLLNPTSPKFEGAFAPQPAAAADSVATLRVVTFNIKLADRIDAAIEVLGSGPASERRHHLAPGDG